MTEAQPLVSIVIPVYNMSRFVAEAIESVLAQTYTPVELIVVDDGSTDDTPAVLAVYADRCRVLRQPNRGQAAALNHGWQSAHGSLMGYLSADDLLHEDAIASSVASLTKTPGAVLTYCDFALIDEAGRQRGIRRVPDYDYLRMVRDFYCLPGPGALFTREAFQGTGPWDPEFRQLPDFEYWLRLGLAGPFTHLRSVLASHRVHSSSQSVTGPSRAGAEEPVRAISKLFSLPALPPEVRALRRRALGAAHYASARLHSRGHRYLEVLAHIAQAALRDPEGFVRSAMLARLGRATLRAIMRRPPPPLPNGDGRA